jgi:hypothetical protein
MAAQSFIVTAGRYSCRADVRLNADREAEVVEMSEYQRVESITEDDVPSLTLNDLETAAIKAFWELGDPHDDTAIDRAEYRRGARR